MNILIIIYPFVNIFAGGRSEIKTTLFFLYFIFLSILFFLFRKYYLKSFKWIWFGLSLSGMYIYGLFLHIYYIFSNNLRITDFIITGNNGEISSSIITHTHITKGIIGQVFSFFGKNNFQTTDAGGAYVGIFPSYIFVLGGILLSFIILQAVYYFLSSFKVFLQNKNKRQKIFLMVGYIIVSFSFIKTSIDGGILNPSFIIGVIFIILFFFREKGKFNQYFYSLIVLISILILGISLYLDTSIYYKLSLGFSSFASLLLLYNFILYGSEKKIRLQFLIPILLLFMISWYSSSVRDRDIYDYSQILIDKGEKIYIYNDKSKEVDTLMIDETKVVDDISKDLNKNITYVPVSIPGFTCMERAKYQEVTTTIVTSYPIIKNKFTPSFFINIKNEDSLYNGKNWKTKLNIFLNPCTPEGLSVINGELIKNGINNYLLINIEILDDTINNK